MNQVIQNITEDIERGAFKSFKIPTETAKKKSPDFYSLVQLKEFCSRYSIKPKSGTKKADFADTLRDFWNKTSVELIGMGRRDLVEIAGTAAANAVYDATAQPLYGANLAELRGIIGKR